MLGKKKLLELIDNGVLLMRGADFAEQYTTRNWKADIRTLLNNEPVQDIRGVMGAVDRKDVRAITQELIKLYETRFGASLRLAMRKRTMAKTE